MNTYDKSTNHRLAKRRPGEDEGLIARTATRLLPCSACGVKAGTVCHSVRGSGNDYSPGVYAHKARRAALDAIWEAGYGLGFERGRNVKRIRRAAA